MAKDLFTEEEKEQIVAAIKVAEQTTSGEIQVHIEKHCKGDVLDRAVEVFSLLKMHRTELRNGVLIYLAMLDHTFAIVGDKGINKVVKNHYWGEVKEHMQAKFKAGSIVDGLCEGIKMVGVQLKEHFPNNNKSKNELPDEISFGKN